MYNMQQDHIEKQRVKRLNRGVNVLISTPGRLKQHLDSNTLHLSKLEFVVIDEADTTINDFRDVRNILRLAFFHSYYHLYQLVLNQS